MCDYKLHKHKFCSFINHNKISLKSQNRHHNAEILIKNLHLKVSGAGLPASRCQPTENFTAADIPQSCLRLKFRFLPRVINNTSLGLLQRGFCMQVGRVRANVLAVINYDIMNSAHNSVVIMRSTGKSYVLRLCSKGA